MIALLFDGLPSVFAELLLVSTDNGVSTGNDPVFRIVSSSMVLKRNGGLQSLVSAAAVGLYSLSAIVSADIFFLCA